MLQCVIFNLVNENLLITLTPQGKEEIQEAIDAGKNIDSDDFMYDLFETPTCNGWEWIAPEDVGALTSAPILSNDTKRNDNGELEDIGNLYWFPNYQIESPVDTLFKTGQVIFQGHKTRTRLRDK